MGDRCSSAWDRPSRTPRRICVENHRALAVVTRQNDAERTDLGGLTPGEPKTVSGPLDWVAVKSKYFVTGVLAYDSTGGADRRR